MTQYEINTIAKLFFQPMIGDTFNGVALAVYIALAVMAVCWFVEYNNVHKRKKESKNRINAMDYTNHMIAKNNSK